jgi:hypothetical protein
LICCAQTIFAGADAVRAALYLRVSTDDQTTENQRRDLEAAAVRGRNPSCAPSPLLAPPRAIPRALIADRP